MTGATPKKPIFEFINSGYTSFMYDPLGVWVRYRKGDPEVKLIEKGPGFVRISCPDRELMLVRNAMTAGADRPLNEGWDEFCSFSWNQSSGEGILSAKGYMINYTSFLGSKRPRSPNIRRPDCLVKNAKSICSDSGGFQMLTHKLSWIDPVDLAKWYGDNCDEGIVLDIPIGLSNDKELITRAATVQDKCTKLMLENLPKGFRLLNASHGDGEGGMSLYRSIVEKDVHTHGMCIGGAYNGNYMSSLDTIFSFITEKGARKYNQYHILGVFNPALTAPLIRMAALIRKHGIAETTITSDSSTAVYCSTNRHYQLQRVHNRGVERIAMGRSSLLQNPNPYRYLPGSDDFSRLIKYADVLAYVDSAIVSHLMITRNANEIDRWASMMIHYAETLSAGDYAALVASQLEGSSGGRSSLIALKFVEDMFRMNKDKLKKNYAVLLDSIFFEGYTEEYTGGKMIEGRDERREELNAEEEAARSDPSNVKKVISKYEEYFKSGKTPDDVPNKSKVRRKGKKIMQNSAVAKKGSKSKKKKKAKRELTEEQKAKGTHARVKNPKPKKLTKAMRAAHQMMA